MLDVFCLSVLLGALILPGGFGRLLGGLMVGSLVCVALWSVSGSSLLGLVSGVASYATGVQLGFFTALVFEATILSSRRAQSGS